MEEAERNGDAKGKNRIRASQKRGVIRKWWHPAFFAFIWISSFSVALLAWRSVCASPRCGNRWFRNGQRKQIIRTHLLSEISSDYIGLVRVVGVEPTRLAAQEPKSCTSANSAIPACVLSSYQPWGEKSIRFSVVVFSIYIRICAENMRFCGKLLGIFSVLLG